MNNPLPPEAHITAEANNKYTKNQGRKLQGRDILCNIRALKTYLIYQEIWKAMCMSELGCMLSKDLRRSLQIQL